MKPVRRIAFAIWFALALLFGQQAAALHDLGHAFDQIAHNGTVPATCDQCFACAQLVGGAAPTLPVVPCVEVREPVTAFFPAADASVAVRLAFRSRAPPTRL